MVKSIIEVENLSKLYHLGLIGVTTLRDSFERWWYRRLGKEEALKRIGMQHNMIEPDDPQAGPEPNTIWALKDVSFSVQPGEILGIIGRNGAGKTTLLKILSRITEPAEGEAIIRGRTASLLEVGTGFHPELTGRENIYLNGAILGMRKSEISAKFDEIVAFAEVEKFIDTPVKRYSSGMYVRLAFAVAAHLEPEILLVDEVLAVGDASFQKKCLGKMESVAKQGRTVLFVSHNMGAITNLCKRTLFVNTGRILQDCETHKVITQYLSFFSSGESAGYNKEGKTTGLIQARVITSEPNQVHCFGKPLVFEFEFAFKEKPKSGAFSFQVIDECFRPIIHLWLFDSEQQWTKAGRALLRCTIAKPRLYMGDYRLVTYLSDRAYGEGLERIEGICPFKVVMGGLFREYPWFAGTCTYLEEAQWQIIR